LGDWALEKSQGQSKEGSAVLKGGRLLQRKAVCYRFLKKE